MMVSKITVIALVALVAIPIGLGYALNFQDVETTGYEAGKTTNITELIRTGTAQNYTQADSYALNTFAFQDAYFANQAVTQPHIPKYVSESKTAGSLSYVHVKSVPTLVPEYPENSQIPWVICYTNVTVPSSTLQLRLSITLNDNTTRVIDNPVSVVINYDLPYETNEDVKMQIIYNDDNPSYMSGYAFTNVRTWTWAAYNGYDMNSKPDQYFYRVNRLDDTRMVTPNLVQGFSLTNFINTNGDTVAAWNWSPGNTPFKDVLLTFDMSKMSGHAVMALRAVSDGSHFPEKNIIQIINDGDTHSIAGQDIIYNAGQPNVYQLWINEKSYELRYVGNWPTSFGEANYYRSWTIPYTSENVENPITFTNGFLCDRITIGGARVSGGGLTDFHPFTIGKMRFDSAALKSNTVPVISNATIDAAKTLGQNQTQTKITTISAAGNSIDFGGIIYRVSNDNKIMVGGAAVSVKNITFDSVLTDQGTYNNRINGYTVSTTEAPSTVKLSGEWFGTNVSIAPLTTVTETESKWIPGGWAWDGVGTSFAVVGLITCVGVFVGLGMYGRRSGAKVGSLMMICAGGALIFLAIM